MPWPLHVSVDAVRRQRGQARIVDRAADREVIERLERKVLEPEHLMHRVVEVAADARGPHACRLGFEIQDLPDQPGFPEQPSIEPGPVRE